MGSANRRKVTAITSPKSVDLTAGWSTWSYHAETVQRVKVPVPRGTLDALIFAILGMHLTQVGPRSCGCQRAESRNNVRVQRLALVLEAFQRPIGPAVTVSRVPSRPASPMDQRRLPATFRKRVADSRDRNLWWLPESSAYPGLPLSEAI